MIARLLFTLPFLLLTANTYAADAADSWDWSGSYIGAHLSAVQILTDYDSDFGVIDSDSYHDKAGALGLHAGHGRMIGGFLLGAEADLQVLGEAKVSSANVRSSGGIIGSPFGGSVRITTTQLEAFESDIRATGSLKARLGYPLGRILPFVSAGVAAGNIKTRHVSLSVTERRPSVGPATRSIEGEIVEISGVDVGYTVGGGAAVAITPRLSLHAEYAFTDLGERSFDLADNQGDVTLGNRLHDVRLGVSFRF